MHTLSRSFRRTYHRPQRLIGSVAACMLSLPPICVVTSQAATSSEKLRLVQTIPLPGVRGRIDHLSIDLKRQRLFVAALGNNTLEIVDVAAGKRLRAVTALNEPQGVRFVPELNKIYVANGGDGVCTIIQGDTLQSTGELKLGDDADNIRYDPQTSSLFVGYANGGLAIIDAKTDRLVSEVRLDGHPESFQLEKQGQRIFVNIPSTKKIVVVDRKAHKVLSTWPLTLAHANYPMALDEVDHCLFVGFRQPSQLGIFDIATGALVQHLSAVGDADDLFYDERLRRVYIIGGEGFVDVLARKGSQQYQRLNRVPTTAGARTGLLVPELNRLYVAVPHRGNHPAEIRGYELLP